MVTIPSSKTPKLLQNLQWVFNPVGYMETNFQRFGDLFRAEILPMNSEPVVLVNHPEAMRYLLTHDSSDEITAPGEVNEIARPFVGGNSILLLSGKDHLQRRKLLMPPFHGERMFAYGERICAIARQAASEWQPGDCFCARDVMQKITMRTISQVVFGLDERDSPTDRLSLSDRLQSRLSGMPQALRDRQLEQRLTEWIRLISTPITSIFFFFPQLMIDLGPQSLGGRIRHSLAELDRLLYDKIHEYRTQPDPERVDVLSMLVSAKDEQGQGLTDQELRDDLFTLLMAGQETTANALTWAMYWIHRYPEVRQNLLEELVPWRNSTDFTEIARLPYLTAVCNETLRIYPGPVAFPRRVEKPIQLMGHDVPVGWLLVACVYLVHHREDLYPNSYTFRPERFFERQFSPYEFLPFGGGRRRCLGAALAMYEMVLVLKTILEQCELELVEENLAKPVRQGGVLAPSGGVWLRKVCDRAA